MGTLYLPLKLVVGYWKVNWMFSVGCWGPMVKVPVFCGFTVPASMGPITVEEYMPSLKSE